MLRRSRSSVSTRCKVRRGFTGTGRFVAAPGREGAPGKMADLESLGLGGERTTGPPSFRFMIAHRSGRRAEKLSLVRRFKYSSQSTYKGAMTSTQKSLRMLSVCFGGFKPLCLSDIILNSPRGAFTDSWEIDCQMQSLSI